MRENLTYGLMRGKRAKPSDLLYNSYGIPYYIKKALRAGAHCGGEVVCRLGDQPQAENPAKQDSFLLVISAQVWYITM